MLRAVETASESESSDREGKSRYYIMYEKGKKKALIMKTKIVNVREQESCF